MPFDEEGFLLGPFYDVDPGRSEIWPVGFQESHEALSLCMGTYNVHSNEAFLDGQKLLISNKDVTEFIQADWDRVFGPVPPNRGFLLAYRAGAFAAGRVAEEIVLRRLLTSAEILGSRVSRYLLFSEAQDENLVCARRGSQSDDLILILDNSDLIIVESKAAFSGSTYLKRCVPKALGRLEATMGMNPHLAGSALCLINLKAHEVTVTTTGRPPDSIQLASK